MNGSYDFDFLDENKFNAYFTHIPLFPQSVNDIGNYLKG